MSAVDNNACDESCSAMSCMLHVIFQYIRCQHQHVPVAPPAWEVSRLKDYCLKLSLRNATVVLQMAN